MLICHFIPNNLQEKCEGILAVLPTTETNSTELIFEKIKELEEKLDEKKRCTAEPKIIVQVGHNK